MRRANLFLLHLGADLLSKWPHTQWIAKSTRKGSNTFTTTTLLQHPCAILSLAFSCCHTRSPAETLQAYVERLGQYPSKPHRMALAGLIHSRLTKSMVHRQIHDRKFFPFTSLSNACYWLPSFQVHSPLEITFIPEMIVQRRRWRK